MDMDKVKDYLDIDPKNISTRYEEERYEEFEVKGAGGLIIGNSADTSCGGIKGFSIGAEWGRFGYTGGVISKEEAVRLARHILRIANLEELGI